MESHATPKSTPAYAQLLTFFAIGGCAAAERAVCETPVVLPRPIPSEPPRDRPRPVAVPLLCDKPPAWITDSFFSASEPHFGHDGSPEDVTLTAGAVARATTGCDIGCPHEMQCGAASEICLAHSGHCTSGTALTCLKGAPR